MSCSLNPSACTRTTSLTFITLLCTVVQYTQGAQSNQTQVNSKKLRRRSGLSCWGTAPQQLAARAAGNSRPAADHRNSIEVPCHHGLEIAAAQRCPRSPSMRPDSFCQTWSYLHASAPRSAHQVLDGMPARLFSSLWRSALPSICTAAAAWALQVCVFCAACLNALGLLPAASVLVLTSCRASWQRKETLPGFQTYMIRIPCSSNKLVSCCLRYRKPQCAFMLFFSQFCMPRRKTISKKAYTNDRLKSRQFRLWSMEKLLIRSSFTVQIVLCGKTADLFFISLAYQWRYRFSLPIHHCTYYFSRVKVHPTRNNIVFQIMDTGPVTT